MTGTSVTVQPNKHTLFIEVSQLNVFFHCTKQLRSDFLDSVKGAGNLEELDAHCLLPVVPWLVFIYQLTVAAASCSITPQ